MAYCFFLHTTASNALALLFAITAAACAGSENENQCLAEPVADCTPDINTDFATIHRSLLSLRCGTSGNACHGEAGRKGDLVLSDADKAYSALLGKDGTHARVEPGDPGCSLLLQRLESDDASKRMPYGEGKLAEGLRCAVRKWIEDGAVR
jgi:hypothetical protein